MSSKLAIGVTIGAVLGAAYDRTFNGATSRVTRLGDTMRAFRGQRDLTEAFERDEAAVGKARIAMDKATAEVLRLRAALKADSGNEQLAKDLEKAKKSAADLSDKLGSARDRSRQSGQAMRQAGLDASKSAQEHVRLGAAIDKVEREQKQLNAVMSRRNQASARIGELRTQLLGLTGVAFAAGRALGQALDVERADVRLSTVVNTSDIGAAVKASRQNAVSFARANLTTEGDILNIEYALNSAGFEASFARSSAGLVAKVSKVTDGTSEQVGEVMATVFNNLGSSLKGTADERLTRIGELLTKTQFKFQIRDFGQLGESFKAASPTLARFNVDLEQGSTLIGALNSAGLQGGEAGTALSASFRGLGKASKEMGFQIARNAQGGIDFTTTLENLSQSIGGFENLSDDTNAALQKAFGDEGVKGVVLLGKQLDKLRDAQKDVTEGSKGLVDKSYQRFLDSAPGKVEILQNNVRLLGTAFGAALLPALNTILPPLVSIASGVGQLMERFPIIGTGIGVVVGAAALWTVGVLAANAATWLWNSAILGLSLGGALARVRTLSVATWGYARGALPGAIAATTKFSGVLKGGAVTAFTGMQAGAVRLGSVLGGVLAKGAVIAGRAIMIVGRALLLNPIGLAVTAIAGAAFLIWDNWSKIGPALESFWGGVKGAATTAWTGIKSGASSLWTGIKSGASTAADGAKKVFSFSPLGMVINNWDAVKGFVSNFGERLKPALGGVFSFAKKVFAFSPLGMVINNWDAVKGFVSNFGERLKPALGRVFAFAKKVFAFSPLGMVINNWDAVKGFLKTLPGTLMTIGGQIVDGLLGGIMAGWDKLKAGVTSLGSGIATQFKTVLGIKSPSRVFMGLGDMLGLGLQQGMLGTTARIAGAALTLAAAATPAFTDSAGPGFGTDGPTGGTAATVVAAAAGNAGGAGRAQTTAAPATTQITIGPIHITQQAGEDAEALAERVAAAIERRAGRVRRASLGDLS